MCVVFGPEVILKNAFAAKEDSVPYLELESLQKFCSILYKKVVAEDRNKNCYKYAYFRVDRNSLEEYCDEDNDFISGINKVYVINKIDGDLCKKINKTYSDDIRNMIEEARKEFANSFKG